MSVSYRRQIGSATMSLVRSIFWSLLILGLNAAAQEGSSFPTSSAHIPVAEPCINCLTAPDGRRSGTVLITYRWTLTTTDVPVVSGTAPMDAMVETVYLAAVYGSRDTLYSELKIEHLGIWDYLARTGSAPRDVAYPLYTFRSQTVNGVWVVTPKAVVVGASPELVVQVAINWSAPAELPPPTPPNPPQASERRVRRDFDGNGRSDIVWTTASGGVAVWLMNGASIIGNAILQTNAVPGWFIAGTGDFNGDGRSDFLWTTSTGGAAIWFMNGTAITGNTLIQNSATTGWKIGGIGDFNGDKKDDILWTTSSGGVAIWLMNGASPVANQVLQSSGVPGWYVAGVADLDGDKKSDLVWTNAAGGVAGWFIAETSMRWQITWSTAAPTGWFIADVGDYDASGKAQIVWRKTDYTAMSIWGMNGSALVDHVLYENFTPSFEYRHAVYDFTGDGRNDILITTRTGQVGFAPGPTPWNGGTQFVQQAAAVPGWSILLR